MKKIYLKIAGFHIKLVFNKFYIRDIQRKLMKDIISDLAGFVILNSTKKLDYSIIFDKALKKEFLIDKKNKQYYMDFFKIISKNCLITYYNISITEFRQILTYVIHDLLVKDCGFILHASANKIDDSSLIFMGKSGAGKTTISKKIKQKFPIIEDDKIIIKKESGKYVLYQTPFIEKSVNIVKTSNPLNIGLLFFLKKAKILKITRISKDVLLNLLTKQLYTNQIDASFQITKLIEFINLYHKNFFFFHSDNKKTNIINSILTKYKNKNL